MICKGCGETDISKFGKTGKLYKDGSPKYKGKCKSCVNAYQREYKVSNPDMRKKFNESTRKWKVANRDKLNEYEREYHKLHPEKAKEYQKQWRRKNTKKLAAYWRDYNKERRAVDPSYVKVKSEHCRVRRLKRRGVGESHTTEQWEALKVATGNKCLCCGVSGYETELTRDHILPITKGGTDAIENIQPLCLSCNSQKHTDHIDYRGVHE